MLCVALIGGKNYTIRRIFFVLIIVACVAAFIYDKNYKTKVGDNLRLGSALIGLSLLFDGLCGATEEQMRSISKPLSLDFLYNLSFWSTSYHGIGTMAICELPKFCEFVTRNPDIIVYFGMVICCTTLGQIFMMSMLSSFGALPVSIVSTTRKFFSVIFSVQIFQNVLTPQQWIASVVIFSTLLIDGVFSKSAQVSVELATNDEIEGKYQHDTNNQEEIEKAPK